MTLKIKNTSNRLVEIAGLNNFRINPNAEVLAPSGYTEEQLILAILPFPSLTLLGGTNMTINTYDTDRNNIVDTSDSISDLDQRLTDLESGSSLPPINAPDVSYTPSIPSNFSTVPTDAQEALDVLSQDVQPAIALRHSHANISVLDDIISIPNTQIRYVDGARVDSYVEDGSDMKPFKTVQSAINSISDASNSKKYLVDIKTGVYLEDLAIKAYVSLRGESKETTKISGTHLASFNTGGRIKIKDLTLGGTLTFDKPSGVSQGVAVWLDSIWADDVIVSFRGANDYFQIINNCMFDSLTHHSSHVLLRDSLVMGDLSTDDVGLEFPDPTYGDSGTRNISNCGCSNTSVAGNSWLEIHNSQMWGTLTSNGVSSYLNYDTTSAPENPSSVISLNSGNISITTHASALQNDSSVSGNTVKDALDNCLVKNGISGSFVTVDGKTITIVDGQVTSIV